MKKIFNIASIFLVSILAVSLFTGCDKKEENVDGNNNPTQNSNLTSPKAKCSLTECIKNLKVENTVAEANEIIGFEGVLVDEKYNKYEWEFNDSSSLTITYYSSDKGTIKIEYDEKDLANDKVDFSKYKEISDKVKTGVSYDEIVAAFGTEGIIIEKSSLSTRYTWVKSDGSYLNASINSKGNCTLLNGRVK